MCGIAGIIHPQASVELVTAMADSIQHRGPDDHGLCRLPNFPHIILAHRRLAILDLSTAAHQPMHDSQTGNVIVYNGELYNHQHIRQSLPNRAYHSHSDTETLLYAYAQWHEKCLSHFNGMFAFALWDHQRNELFLARDRLGIKPLYYAERPDGFIFASQLKALLASTIVPPKINHAALPGYLAMGAVVEPDTIVQDVKLLLPGHYLRVNAQGRIIEQRQWYDLHQAYHQKPHTADPDQIDTLVTQAIKRRLISDVPLGAFLSGGIDSSVIVGKMAQQRTSAPHTFCLTFDQGRYHEGPYAQAVADTFHCQHQNVPISARELLSYLYRAFDIMDQPTHDGINSYIVSSIARTCGVTVALSGQGGDEVFAGYPSFRFLPRLRHLAAIPRPCRTVLAHALSPIFPSTFQWQRITNLLAAPKAAITAAYAHWRCLFLDNQVAQLLPASQTFSLTSLLESQLSQDCLSRDPVNQVSQLELHFYLRNVLLRDLDCFSMAHSLEVRVPLLDHQLIEYLAAIPGRSKRSPHVNKPLLLNTLPNQLPPQTFQRPKAVFWLPFENWMRHELHSHIDHIFAQKDFLAEFSFDPDVVESLWQDYQQHSSTVHWTQIWSLFSLFQWLHKNNIKA